jgi:hypothetical protein
MRDEAMEEAVLGAAAGVLASVVQAAIGKTEEKLMLPPWEDSNIAPRLVDRVLRHAGVDDPSLATEWILGTGYHVAYGAAWGAAYAAVRERHPVRPLVGGALLGGLIYGITFPSWGGAVQTDTERPPARRSRGMELVAVSVTLGFGWATAFAYEYLRSSPTARDLASRIGGGEEEVGERG